MHLLDRDPMGYRHPLIASAARLLVAVGAFAGLFAAANPAGAQRWPDKPIHFVVSAPAGSSLDALARVIGDRLKDRIGQSVIVENKPAAGGTVAFPGASQDGLEQADAGDIHLSTETNATRHAVHRDQPAAQLIRMRVDECVQGRGEGFPTPGP